MQSVPLWTVAPWHAPQDPGSQAKTLLYRIEVDRGVSWEHAQQLLAEGGQAAPSAAAAHPGPGGAQADPEQLLSGFYRRASAVVALSTTPQSRAVCLLQQGTCLSPTHLSVNPIHMKDVCV